MARINNGIMGGFSGKVGTVVGYTRLGQACMRSIPAKSLKEPSESQLLNRKAMKAAMEWLKPIKEFVRIGFKNYSPKQHGFGSAVSFTKQNALREDKTVDPSLAMISWGDLLQAEDVAVSNTRPGILEFTWNPEMGGTERALVLAYVDKEHISGDLCGSRKKDGLHVLVCENLIGKEADIYLGFVSEERDRCSNSVYLGKVKIE